DPRITTLSGITAGRAGQRPSSATAEDRNIEDIPTFRRRLAAAVLRDGRGSQLHVHRVPLRSAHAAAVLRDGRGSQRQGSVKPPSPNDGAAAVLGDGRGSQHDRGNPPPVIAVQRPSSATAEDRNQSTACSSTSALSSGRPPRRPRIATARRYGTAPSRRAAA